MVYLVSLVCNLCVLLGEVFVYFTLSSGFSRYTWYLWCFLCVTCVSCLVNDLCTLHCQVDSPGISGVSCMSPVCHGW